MRKVVFVAAAAIGALSVAACKETPEEVASTEPTESAEANIEPVTPEQEKAFIDALEKTTSPVAAGALALEAPTPELQQKARDKANALLKAKTEKGA